MSTINNKRILISGGGGASLAMAGAYVLAKKLAAEDEYEKAFAGYEAHVRPYAAKAQKTALGPVKLIAGKSRLSYRFTNWILRLLPASLLRFIFTRLHTHKLEMPLD